jgi:hypothetical protein
MSIHPTLAGAVLAAAVFDAYVCLRRRADIEPVRAVLEDVHSTARPSLARSATTSRPRRFCFVLGGRELGAGADARMRGEQKWVARRG